MRILAALALSVLAGCATMPLPEPTRPEPAPTSEAQIRAKAEVAARRFLKVAADVEPVAEAECKRRAPDLNCDFQIVVDDRLGQPPNAYQTVDANGRPILAFTLGLIADAQNADELAFVMGHEAAHHIAGHIPRMQANAAAGAAILSGLAAITGASTDMVRTAQDVGAAVGARSYSKDFELEADRLGTVIAARAGYDPVLGAAYFTRIPDPGDRFLGSHPPNAARIETVREAAAAL